MRPWYVAVVLQFRGHFAVWSLQKLLIHLQFLPAYPISFPDQTSQILRSAPIEKETRGLPPALDSWRGGRRARRSTRNAARPSSAADCPPYGIGTA
jgi:hypothetical protein